MRIAVFGIGHKTENFLEYIRGREIDATVVYCIESVPTMGGTWNDIQVKVIDEVSESEFEYMVLCVAKKSINKIMTNLSRLKIWNDIKDKILSLDEFYITMGHEEDVKREEVIEYPQESIVQVGTEYGGYKIDERVLEDNPIVFSFGIGEDLSFDIEMIRRYRAKVYAFDPTPKSIEYVNNNSVDGLSFMPVAISDTDGEEKFFLPNNDECVSGSIHIRNELKSAPIIVETKRFSTICEHMGMYYIDILKMDIEGSEFEVLPDILGTSACEIRQICIEFHERFFWDGNKRLNDAIGLLHNNGYKIAAINHKDSTYTFIHSRLG